MAQPAGAVVVEGDLEGLIANLKPDVVPVEVVFVIERYRNQVVAVLGLQGNHTNIE